MYWQKKYLCTRIRIDSNEHVHNLYLKYHLFHEPGCLYLSAVIQKERNSFGAAKSSRNVHLGIPELQHNVLGCQWICATPVISELKSISATADRKKNLHHCKNNFACCCF